MKVSKHFINFNKQFIFGEVGSMISAPVAGYIASTFFSSPDVISALIVAGAAIGGLVPGIGMRIYDQIKVEKVSKKQFLQDAAYLYPIASLLIFTIYYPSLFFLSRYFISHGYTAIGYVIGSQIVSYAIFLSSLNLYRYLLLKFTGRNL
ncbi:hypothetical protein A3K62_02740 [Candidatus Pacearchaeota archaeon RBG_16_35_8]|nr:MAG: hypothetical protein A3K62_02740 [Candidatus Pacearchaeota archaeon RBG_16_35_8]